MSQNVKTIINCGTVLGCEASLPQPGPADPAVAAIAAMQARLRYPTLFEDMMRRGAENRRNFLGHYDQRTVQDLEAMARAAVDAAAAAMLGDPMPLLDQVRAEMSSMYGGDIHSAIVPRQIAQAANDAAFWETIRRTPSPPPAAPPPPSPVHCMAPRPRKLAV